MKQFFLFFLSSVFILNMTFGDDWNGIDYAPNSSVQLSHAQRLLKNLSLKGDEIILDVGCGDGKITALLAKRVPEGIVMGLDPSTSMLIKARDTQKEYGDLSNLTFFQGAAENFSLPQSFDHIIAIHVMHWVKEQEEALKNIYAHLKPSGQIHFILAPSKEGLPFHRALHKTMNSWETDFIDFINPQQVFDMETYRKLLVKAGFHVEAIHYLYHESIHESKDKLKDWIKQWLPHGKHLSPPQQESFLDQLITNYLTESGFSPNTSDPVKWGEYVLIIQGRKL